MKMIGLSDVLDGSHVCGPATVAKRFVNGVVQSAIGTDWLMDSPSGPTDSSLGERSRDSKQHVRWSGASSVHYSGRTSCARLQWQSINWCA